MVKRGRITIDPKIMGGVPCIRNLRMPAATILAMMAEGKSEADILIEHPELEVEDIHEVLLYAAELFRTREFPLAI